MKFSTLTLLATRILVNILDLLAKETIAVIGDSHVRVFRHPAMKWYFPLTKFDVTEVGGATASGIDNPNSKTQAYNIFLRKLSSLSCRNNLIILLGEVDCGFVIWYQREKYKCELQTLLLKTVDKYFKFIKQASEIAKVVVISAPLPTIKDDSPLGEVANLRATIKASEEERTKLTLTFNSIIEKLCIKSDIAYLNLDAISLDNNGRLLKSLVNKNPTDHHYNQASYSRILAQNLRDIFP